MRHTPTPWRPSETCDHRPAIQDAGGLTVASWDSATVELFGDVRPTILRAVNSHAALLEAVEHIIAMADDAYLSGHPEWVEIVNQAKHAKAQAEGGA